MSLSSSGRVTATHARVFLVFSDFGERLMSAAGHLETTPVVGDFVRFENEVIQTVLPRRSVLQRIAPGRSQELQTLAANLDILFVVSGLDDDFNLRRLERYLVLAISSGAEPVFVLTKADLFLPDRRAELDAKVALARSIAGRCRVLVSAVGDESAVAQIRTLLSDQTTAALIGSSGVGKSTLVNRLLGDARQQTQEVRATDGKGRHTTASRQMFRLPGGGWLIDQPGIREIQISVDADQVSAAFPDIAELSAQCRFRDCRHEREPGCAVRAQVDSGRLRNWAKLRRETQREGEDLRAAPDRKKLDRTIHPAIHREIHRAMRSTRNDSDQDE